LLGVKKAKIMRRSFECQASIWGIFLKLHWTE
jgi:hypothetical protein